MEEMAQGAPQGAEGAGPEQASQMIDKVLMVIQSLAESLPPEILEQFKGKVMEILGGGAPEEEGPVQPNKQAVAG